MPGAAGGARRGYAVSYALFLALPVALFLAAYVYPVFYTIDLSLHVWDGMSPNWSFSGIDNYVALFHDERFLHSLGNNFRWLVFYMVAPTLVGLALALLLDGAAHAPGLFKAVFFIPFTMTPVAVAAIWRWMYEPATGVVSQLLAAVGLSALDQSWLGDPGLVSYSIMAAALWWWTGFAFLVYFGGLRSLPPEYAEAARVDGASAWAVTWRIKLPLLWPSTIVVVGVAGVDAMRVFDIIWGMTNGGPYQSSDVLATQMYDVSFTQFTMGKGSAIAVCLMAIAAVVVLPYVYRMARRVEESGE